MYNVGNDILLIDKPKNWSSYDVIRFLKPKLKVKKIGHAGTLDPMATGLLIILLGDATKRFDEFQGVKKEYEAVIEFGKKTDTYDREGKVIFEYKKTFKISKKEIEIALKNFTGKIKQKPPPHSAIKIGGKRAYELARSGKIFELAPREVEVYEAKVLKVLGKKVWVKFVVSSGTYIRSLANDLGEVVGLKQSDGSFGRTSHGEVLGYGAYLYDLKRTKIGEYSLDQAKRPEEINLEV